MLVVFVTRISSFIRELDADNTLRAERSGIPESGEILRVGFQKSLVPDQSLRPKVIK